MTTYNKQTLKTFFEQGDKPQGSDYANLIDSQVNIVETSVQSMGGALQTTELITPRVSAANLNVTSVISANQFHGIVNFREQINSRDGIYVDPTVGIRIGASGYSGSVNNLVISNSSPYTAIVLNVSGANSVVQSFYNDNGLFYVGYGTNSAATNAILQSTDSIDAIVQTSFNVRGTVNTAPYFTVANGSAQAFNNLRQSVAIISAAGSTQGTAALCSAAICRLQGVVDGVTTGFSIVANAQGWVQYILNETATSANLWPPTGGTINGNAANQVFALAAKTSYTIFHVGASAYGVK